MLGLDLCGLGLALRKAKWLQPRPWPRGVPSFRHARAQQCRRERQIFPGDEGARHTTNRPSEQVAAAAEEQWLHPHAAEAHDGQRHPMMIDAPVSGGVPGAQAGSLTFMVGGVQGLGTGLRNWLEGGRVLAHVLHEFALL